MIRIAAVGVAAVALRRPERGARRRRTRSPGPSPRTTAATSSRSRPRCPGISARVVDLGNKFELTNRTSTEITVLGYEGEPYLRIGPNGVFENLHSQATYINRTRQGGTVPVGIDTSPTATPEWKKISSGHTRALARPSHPLDERAAAAAGRAVARHVPPPLATEHRRSCTTASSVRIAVALDWVPGPSGLPWVPPIVVLFALGVLGAVLPKSWRVLAVLARSCSSSSDIAHAIGFEIPRPGGNLSKFVQFLGGSFVSIAVWIAAVPTIIALLRRRVEALYGVVFVALLVALIGGATDLSALWKSQLPDAGPPWLTRVEVVIALGLGGGLVVGALVRMMRSRAVDRRRRPGPMALAARRRALRRRARAHRRASSTPTTCSRSRSASSRRAPRRCADAFARRLGRRSSSTDQDAPVVWSIGRVPDGPRASARRAAAPSPSRPRSTPRSR